MCAARQAAIEAAADLLIAVGGGSVIVATRAVAIFMAEPGDPFQIMTQYPEGKPAYSPRLLAPKPPIINIPTTPNSAMNRAGTGLKNPDLDHRMEYFDPKTRPLAIFLDEDALLSAPPDLIRSTATTVFAGLVGAMAQLESIRWPRATATMRSGWRTAPIRDWLMSATIRPCASISASRPSCRTAPRTMGPAASAVVPSPATTPSRRRCMCATRMSDRASSTSVVHAPKIRLSEGIDVRSARQVAEAIAVWRDGMDGRQAALAVADTLETLYARIGVPTRLRQLNIPREDLRTIANETVKNFNANAGLRSAEEQIEDAFGCSRRHSTDTTWL